MGNFQGEYMTPIERKTILSLKYLPIDEAIRELAGPLSKSPSIPLYKRGMTTCSPLWQRGVRGDLSEILTQLGDKGLL